MVWYYPMVSASIQCILWFASLHLLAFMSMYNGDVCKGRMGNGKGATVFEWLNCPICQNKQPPILSNDFLLWSLSRKIFRPPAGVRQTVDVDSCWCEWLWDCCRGSLLWRRGDDSSYARPRLPSSPSLQCHPMPWERLINICIEVILIPCYPCLTLHAMSSALPGNCLQWFWRR